MKLLYFFTIIFFLFTNALLAQDYLTLNGGYFPCSWSDKSGHHGQRLCHILSQGSHMGRTVRLMSINNKKLAYLFEMEEGRVSLIDLVKKDKTYWVGKFKSISDKKDIFRETIYISDGVTITLINR